MPNYDNRLIRMISVAILMVAVSVYTMLVQIEPPTLMLGIFWSLTFVHTLCTAIYARRGHVYKICYYKTAIYSYAVLEALCVLCVLARDLIDSAHGFFHNFGTFCLYMIPLYSIAILFTMYLLAAEQHKRKAWRASL